MNFAGEGVIEHVNGGHAGAMVGIERGGTERFEFGDGILHTLFRRVEQVHAAEDRADALAGELVDVAQDIDDARVRAAENDADAFTRRIIERKIVVERIGLAESFVEEERPAGVFESGDARDDAGGENAGNDFSRFLDRSITILP